MVSSLANIPVSVLDLVPVVDGSNPTIALNQSVDLARHAEELGYCRYWLAEHHNLRGVAAAATAVLVGQVAASTQRIRVGSGGVMLPIHPALLVAEEYGTLEAFHPGRIDLGVTRAAGRNPRTSAALGGPHGRPAVDDFLTQLDELIGYFDVKDGDGGSDDTVEGGEDRRGGTVRAIPALGNRPPVWMLGSSEASAQLAAARGLPYVFAQHLEPRNIDAALRVYRESFLPSTQLAEPYVMLSVSVIAADTDEKAEWIAGPSKLKYLRRHQNRPIGVQTPERAAAYSYSETDTATIERGFAAKIVGSPVTVRDRLRELVSTTGADEIMVTTRVHDHEDRKRSFTLVAEATR
jgi:luciferase family oxidoreductase group 1